MSSDKSPAGLEPAGGYMFSRIVESVTVFEEPSGAAALVPQAL